MTEQYTHHAMFLFAHPYDITTTSSVALFPAISQSTDSGKKAHARATVVHSNATIGHSARYTPSAVISPDRADHAEPVTCNGPLRHAALVPILHSQLTIYGSIGPGAAD